MAADTEPRTDIFETLGRLGSAPDIAVDAVARRILSGTELRMRDESGRVTPARIVEIEFYVDPDPFIHASGAQKEQCGTWYFHRAGRSPTAGYRGGTFKGVDLTCGEEHEVAGGILIRAISLGDRLAEGPSKTVDAILETCGAGSIAELVERFDQDGVCPAGPGAPLEIIERDEPLEGSVVAARRVGLSNAAALRASGGDKARVEAAAVAPLRFAWGSDVKSIRRQKGDLLAAIIADKCE